MSEIYECPKQDDELGKHAILISGYGIENDEDYYWVKKFWGVNG